MLRLVPLALLLGCNVPVGAQQSAIIGGQETATHPEVAALVYDGDFLCSAVLVGPRQLVTAAHCLYGLENDPTPLGAVFAANVTGATIMDVADAVVHPDYASTPSQDIAIAWLADDAPVPPVPWNATPLTDADLGAPIEIVGFGDPAFGDDAGDRLRRTATVPLGELTSTHARWNEAGVGTCHGDSGGGAFMDLGGGAVLVGVHSEGDPQCAGWGSATRTDVFDAFLDDPSAGDDDDDATGAFGDDDDSIGTTDCGCSAADRGSASGWLVVLVLSGLATWRRLRARAPSPLRRGESPPRP